MNTGREVGVLMSHDDCLLSFVQKKFVRDNHSWKLKIYYNDLIMAL